MKRPIVLTSIVFLIIILLVFFVILPKYQELSSKEFQLEEKIFEYKTLEEYFAKLSSNKKELENYQSELTKINLAIPDELKIPSLFYFIQKTAEANNLLLTAVSLDQKKREPDEDLKKSEIKENRALIVVAGPYSSFKNFLLVLERSTRFIEVEEISFSTEQTEKISKGSYFFNLKIKVYSY